MIEGPKFEFYVLNSGFNDKDVKPYNIFDNRHVYESTFKEVKKYVRSPSKYKNAFKDEYGFEGFVKELSSIIMWQEWSRIEYEICVSWPFASNEEEIKKIDCFYQAKPNMEVIARDVIYQYKQWKKTQADSVKAAHKSSKLG